jgi:ABC-type uncharacterized transport system ATPase subunit
VAGVAGNGQSELGLIAAGVLQPTKGKVYFLGNAIWSNGFSAIKRGIAFVPEDGPETGIVPSMSVKENLILKSYGNYGSRWGLMKLESVDEIAKQLVERFDIRPRDVNLPAKLLSGGNLQKLILARELSGNPDVLVAMNPTKGLDIKSRDFIHDVIRSLRNRGCAILLVSHDLEEVLNLADRVLVMSRGRIVGQWKRNEVSREALGLAMGSSGSR